MNGNARVGWTLDAASLGIPVFPLMPRDKVPAVRHWLEDATTDPDRITRWWTDNPDLNVGYRTGVVHDVLDIDGPEGLDALDAAAPDEPPLMGPMLYTSKGIHIYFQATGLGNKARFVPGCDWRGRHGYVVGAASIHPTGAVYEWTDLTLTTSLQPVPAWLLELLNPPPPRGRSTVATAPLDPSRGDGSRYGVAAVRRACERVAGAAEGTRNDELNRQALGLYQLAAGGEVTEALVEECLTDAALSAGLGQREITATLRSARAAGIARPRRAS